MTAKRDLALDACIELLATDGLRAATHQRIDERAGLPRGSTSNYFRSRSALLAGTVNRILEREMVVVDSLSEVTSADHLVDRLVAALIRATTQNRVLTAAKLVLFVEGHHSQVLREEISRGADDVIAVAAASLAALGARDPVTGANAIRACFAGLQLQRIARDDETDPRPILDLVVKAALS
jgi:DNA-binding transcriptional regulator YbjK